MTRRPGPPGPPRGKRSAGTRSPSPEDDDVALHELTGGNLTFSGVPYYARNGTERLAQGEDLTLGAGLLHIGKQTVQHDDRSNDGSLKALADEPRDDCGCSE